MTHRSIIDAGPGLNFLSINHERLLIAMLGPLSTPETVKTRYFAKLVKTSALPEQSESFKS